MIDVEETVAKYAEYLKVNPATMPKPVAVDTALPPHTYHSVTIFRDLPGWFARCDCGWASSYYSSYAKVEAVACLHGANIHPGAYLVWNRAETYTGLDPEDIDD